MNWWQATVLGITQGLTEFLPVSSSGHLILMREFLGVWYGDFLMFDLLLHVATLVAIVMVFHKDIIKLFKPPFKVALFIVLASIPAAIAGFALSPLIRSVFYYSATYLWAFFLLTAILLLISEMYEKRQTPKAFILDNINGAKRLFLKRREKAERLAEEAMLKENTIKAENALGAKLLINDTDKRAVNDRPYDDTQAGGEDCAERRGLARFFWNKNKNHTNTAFAKKGACPKSVTDCSIETNGNNPQKDNDGNGAFLPDLKLKHALAMGLMQAVAIFPGVSRSGSTIFGGVMTRGKRKTVAKFSFLMSIPVVLGALLVDVIDVARGAAPAAAVIPWYAYVLGILLSFVVGFFAIKFMMRLISKADFKWFSLYLFGLSILTFVIFLPSFS